MLQLHKRTCSTYKPPMLLYCLLKLAGGVMKLLRCPIAEVDPATASARMAEESLASLPVNTSVGQREPAFAGSNLGGIGRSQRSSQFCHGPTMASYFDAPSRIFCRTALSLACSGPTLLVPTGSFSALHRYRTVLLTDQPLPAVLRCEKASDILHFLL